MRDAVALLDARKVDFEYDGEISPDVALEPSIRALFPFCRLTAGRQCAGHAGAAFGAHHLAAGAASGGRDHDRAIADRDGAAGADRADGCVGHARSSISRAWRRTRRRCGRVGWVEPVTERNAVVMAGLDPAILLRRTQVEAALRWTTARPCGGTKRMAGSSPAMTIRTVDARRLGHALVCATGFGAWYCTTRSVPRWNRQSPRTVRPGRRLHSTNPSRVKCAVTGSAHGVSGKWMRAAGWPDSTMSPSSTNGSYRPLSGV